MGKIRQSSSSAEDEQLSTNSASRILVFVELLIQLPTGSGMSIAQAIRAAFEADISGQLTPLSREHIATNNRLVEALDKEIDLWIGAVAAKGFSTHLCSPYGDRLKSIIWSENQSSPWANVRPQIDGELILGLKYGKEIMDSEPAISIQELQSIIDDLNALKVKVEGGSLSVVTRDFIISQIDIIERAIKEYPIKGGAAIADGLQGFFFKCVTDQEAAEQAVGSAKEEVSVLVRCVEGLKKAVEPIDSVSKIVTGLSSIAAGSSAFTQFLLN